MGKEVSFTMKEMKRYSLIQALLEKKMTKKSGSPEPVYSSIWPASAQPFHAMELQKSPKEDIHWGFP